MTSRTTTLILLLATLLAPGAQAYLYDEHCVVSNQGLLLAALRAAGSPSGPGVRLGLDPADVALLRGLTRSSCRERALRSRGGPRAPRAASYGDVSYGDMVALVDYAMSPIDFYLYVANDAAADDFAGGVLPEASLRALAETPLDHLRAASNNDDHFQDRALLAYHVYHRFAVHLAAAEGNLISALVVNAYADHFLQDALAPGHVRTPRRNLHNAATIGLHDYYNGHGLIFWPRRTGALADMAASGVPEELEALFDVADGSVERYLQLLEEMGFPVYGDGQLERSPTQRLYLVLLSARSVMDVLESYGSGEATNSFGTYGWSGYRAVGDRRYSPAVEIAFGEYRCLEDSWMLAFVPIVGTSVGHQSLFRRDGGSSRVWVAAELFLVGSPGTSWIASEKSRTLGLPQFLLPIGYSVVSGGGAVGHGPMLRFVLPVSALNTQLSASAGYRWYRADDVAGRGLHAGLRVEMGVGLMEVGIGIDYDRQIDSEGWFRPHLGLTSSLSFALTTGQLFPF